MQVEKWTSQNLRMLPIWPGPRMLTAKSTELADFYQQILCDDHSRENRAVYTENRYVTCCAIGEDLVMTASSENLESSVQQIGEELARLSAGQSPTLFERQWWSQAAMNLAMHDLDFKTQ